MSLYRTLIRINGINRILSNSRPLSTSTRYHFQNKRSSRILLHHLKHLNPASVSSLISQSARNFSVTPRVFSDENIAVGSGNAGDGAEKFFIPEPPTPPTAVDESSTELLLNHLGEPTFKSLDIGTSYFPSDFILKFLEQLHVGVELPWWGVLGVATVVVRCVMFPLIVNFRKKSTNFSNHMPTVKKLQERMDSARLQNNILEMSKISTELNSFIKRNDVVSMKSMFLFPVINIGIIISFLSAIRQMANYPIASMQDGGLFWFTDLTLPDTYCLLPLTCVASMYIIMEIGADMTKISSQSKGMKYVMRGFPIVVFFFMMNMPSAVTYYFTLSNFFSIIQTKALKTTKLRNYFGIPEEVKHPIEDLKPKEKKSFYESFSDSRRRAEMLRIVAERERLDDKQFREAGKALVKKTRPLKISKSSDDSVKELRRA